MMNMFKHLKFDSFTYSEHMIKTAWKDDKNIQMLLLF